MGNKVYKHNEGPYVEYTKDITVLIDTLNSLVEDNNGEFKFEYSIREPGEFLKLAIHIRFYFMKNTSHSEENMLTKGYDIDSNVMFGAFFKNTYKDILRMIIFTRDFDNGAIKCTEYAKLIRNYGK